MKRIIPLILLLLFPNLFWSCAIGADPDNLEPEIITLEAEEITRNEATVSVRIETRGTGKLSNLCFFYGEGGNCNRQTENLPLGSEVVSFRLNNLKSGTTYSFFAQGNTSTATIKSQTLNFTTNPNEKPVITGATPLTSGPVAIIVEFEILEDGGDTVNAAGCDVTNTTTNKTERYLLSDEHITPGKKKILINGLSPLTNYNIVPFAANSIGEAKGETISFTTQNSVVIAYPGSLSEIFDNNEVTLESINISGKMNGDDFRFLRRMLKAPGLTGDNYMNSNLTSVNITDVEIVEGGATYDGSHFTENDIISSGLFSNCVGLQSISLPLTAIKLAKDAFIGCTKLRTLTIPANISELLPSSGCEALEKINVSEANINYISIEGVLFNNDASEILWFPLGKTGEYKLPSSVKAIGENAFRGTRITTLIIPDEIETISRGAFSGSLLTDITLSDLMTNISEGLFQDCQVLKRVRFGKSTEYISNYIFDGCNNLQDIYIGAVVPPIVSTYSFSNRQADIFATCTLHVPAGSKSRYANHTQWGKFKNIVEFN